MSKRTQSQFLDIDGSVFTVAAVSLVIMAFAAARSDKMLAIAGAVVFSARLLSSALGAKTAASPLAVLRQSARYSCVSLVWGAAALLIAYPVIGLKWQHGWQYGLGAAVIGALFFWYSQRLEQSGDPWAQPRALQVVRIFSALLAAAIAAAAGWLILSGKLLTEKNDWLANDVFLAIAACLFTLSLISFFRAR